MNKKTKKILKKFRGMTQVFEQSENPLSCDYYDIPDLKKLKINKQQDLSIFHLAISSISANIAITLLNLVNHKFDIICTSKSTNLTKHPQKPNIDLPGFKIEQTPTEFSSGGTLINIPETSHINLERIPRYTNLKNWNLHLLKCQFLTRYVTKLDLFINTPLLSTINLATIS